MDEIKNRLNQREILNIALKESKEVKIISNSGERIKYICILFGNN
jgi:hypothetical protein